MIIDYDNERKNHDEIFPWFIKIHMSILFYVCMNHEIFLQKTKLCARYGKKLQEWNEREGKCVLNTCFLQYLYAAAADHKWFTSLFTILNDFIANIRNAANILEAEREKNPI